MNWSSSRDNEMKKHRYSLLLLVIVQIFFVTSCSERYDSGLPVLGKITEDFKFYNQDNEVVTSAILDNKIYVTDFFFTSCPTICPIMKRQMQQVYEKFKGTPDFILLSHTIDPEFDTVEVLNKFAKGLGAETSQWQMVTGDQDEIFAMAKHYMLGAMKKDDVPGGYIHSGSFVLVDKEKRIRGYYSGTDPDEVEALIVDLGKLIKESS